MKIKRYKNIINQGIIISWTPEGKGTSRTLTISKKLSIPLKRFHIFTRKKFLAPFKFPILIFKTFLFLIKRKPYFIIVDVTQPFIIIPVYIYSKMKGIPFLCDLHSGPIVAPHLKPFRNFLFFLLKKSEMVILHEPTIKKFFKKGNIKTMVLHDPLPLFHKKEISLKSEPKYMVYVSVGAPDEPINPVLEAFKEIKKINLYITGAWDTRNLKDIPQNVKFTGFLKRNDFEELLLKSYGIMAFTKWEYTLLGAAYEALSISKPLLTSSTNALKEFFKNSAIFVEHTPDSIIKGVDKLISNYEFYLNNIKNLKENYIREFEEEFQNFKSFLFSILKKYYHKL